MTEVLSTAGEPSQRRVISVGISIGAIVGHTREQWTYRSYDGVYVLTFVGDEVLHIRVVPFR